jgi:hypothetical protein
VCKKVVFGFLLCIQSLPKLDGQLIPDGRPAEKGVTPFSRDVAMESPCLWFWDTRFKLMLMVSLVHAFLFSLLTADLDGLLAWLLRHWCH